MSAIHRFEAGVRPVLEYAKAVLQVPLGQVTVRSISGEEFLVPGALLVHRVLGAGEAGLAHGHTRLVGDSLVNTSKARCDDTAANWSASLKAIFARITQCPWRVQSISIQRTFTELLGAITGRTLTREAQVSIWRWIGR